MVGTVRDQRVVQPGVEAIDIIGDVDANNNNNNSAQLVNLATAPTG